MSTVTPIIDHVEDLWPADGGPDDALGPAGARVAPAGREPRGVELRRRQHVGQGHDDRPRRARGQRDVGQGLRLRPRDDGPGALHRAQARRDAAAAGPRRDDRRGHGRLPRPLPARPADAARVDRDAAARVRPRAARAPHAPGRHQRARRHRRRRAADRRSASATRRPGSRTSARASRCPSRSASRCATTRASSSSCWPSTA